MNNPKFSVIIPAYNGREHLGEAIQSVLGQTLQDFEIIIVDDRSPEPQDAVVGRFSDPRIRFVQHEHNRGAVAARRTGVHASSGELIALLDQDDVFHPQKLELHAAYMQEHPDVGMTYNGHFEVMGSIDRICGVSQPPDSITLADWVLGFPVAPSDSVLRREWACRDEIWDDSFADQAEHVIFNGQEIVFGGRLALAGCKFGRIKRALNYRRYDAKRVLRHLELRCRSEIACQKIILEDPRCPPEISARREEAASNIYIMWAFTAYMQREFEAGREFLLQAVKRAPLMLQGDPCHLLPYWVSWISMGTSDYERPIIGIFEDIFQNLPVELEGLKKYSGWALERGHLLRGIHRLIWNQEQEARESLNAAAKMGAPIDEIGIQMMVGSLLAYQSEYGIAAARKKADRAGVLLHEAGMQEAARHLRAAYAANLAMMNYRSGDRAGARSDVVEAVRNHPPYLRNRGLISVFVRSFLG